MSKDVDQLVSSAIHLQELSEQWIRFVTGGANRPPERLSVQLSSDGFLCTLLRDEDAIPDGAAEPIRAAVANLKGHVNPLSIKDVDKAIKDNAPVGLVRVLDKLGQDFKTVEDSAIKGFDVCDVFASVYAEHVVPNERIVALKYKNPQSERFVAAAKIFANAMLYATVHSNSQTEADPRLHARDWFYLTLSILAGVGVNCADGKPVLFTEDETIAMCKALGSVLELLKNWVFNSPQNTGERDFGTGELKRTVAYSIGAAITNEYGKRMLGKTDCVPVVRELFFTAVDTSDGVGYRYWGNRFDEVVKFCPQYQETVSVVSIIGQMLSDPEMQRIASAPDEDEDLYGDDFDAYEATKRSWERARAKYRREIAGLNVPSAILHTTAIDRVKVSMRRLVEGLDEGVIPNFDLTSVPELERILLLQPWLIVRNYDIDPADWESGGEFAGCDDYRENNGFPYVSEWHAIPEKAACDEICRLFVSAIETTAVLAKCAAAKSYDDWARLLLVVKDCNSSFYNFRYQETKRPKLQEILKTIKRILPGTRVDVEVYARIKAQEEERRVAEASPAAVAGDRIVSGVGRCLDAFGAKMQAGFDASERRDKELQDTAEANNALGQDVLHRMKNFSKNKSFGKQWGETVRTAMRNLWLDNKHNQVIRSNLDHPIRQEDVFEYFKVKIARYGVTEFKEFKSIIEASRKTDGALKGRKLVRKPSRKTTKRKR